MKYNQIIERRKVEIPDEVTVTIESGKKIVVKGKLGKLEKSFPRVSTYVEIQKEEGKKVLAIWDYFPKKRQKAMVGTIQGLINNMITGVQKGYSYKLKIIYSHFPITVTTAKNGVIITGQYGNREKRFIPIYKGIKTTVKGEDLTLEGNDLEKVSQSAARIQESTKLRGKYSKDPRIFQDGIYIYESGPNV
ncbi:MAG: 50S ribosomal protein L6 [Candidatus Heimdallarchaeota archaeon LC_3]|uniref:Putative 50S ribosomal protein L6 n=1 Tax=uncultured organism TaxID=155900 RepID=A0A0F6PXE1_9ZZZZ|nr:putative 50S ribosomal protein L6 [uncultured organism]OLS16639.1 MAG: 50S ribosomal protein L6 [Candidatus Heimdallarchaeota archaeon LC_3]